jgi:hypothetical protein
VMEERPEADIEPLRIVRGVWHEVFLHLERLSGPLDRSGRPDLWNLEPVPTDSNRYRRLCFRKGRLPTQC